MTPPNSTVEHIRSIRASLPDAFEFDERDLALLALAEHALEADIRTRGIRPDEGRLNPSVREARFARAVLSRILGAVDMPEVGTTASLDAQKAANERWKAAS